MVIDSLTLPLFLRPPPLNEACQGREGKVSFFEGGGGLITNRKWKGGLTLETFYGGAKEGTPQMIHT